MVRAVNLKTRFRANRVRVRPKISRIELNLYFIMDIIWNLNRAELRCFGLKLYK